MTAGHHRPEARQLYESLGYDADGDGLPAQEALTGRSPATARRPTACPAGFPRLRLRDRASKLLELPWELPLADWPATTLHFRDLPVGPSRHLVRFLVVDGLTYALKEEPLGVATDRVRRPAPPRGRRAAGGPGGRPGRRRPNGTAAILMTEYLAYSIQYRRLLMRFPLGPGPVPRPAARRDGVAARRPASGRRLLGRLLAREHPVPARRRQDPGLPRRRGDQRDPSVAVRRPARPTTSTSSSRTSRSGWPTSRRCRAGRRRFEDAVAAAETVRTRYSAVWEELHLEPELSPGDRHAIRARIRRLNELGLRGRRDRSSSRSDRAGGRPAARRRRQPPVPRPRAGEADGLVALEGQARLLLNDLREYRAWLESRAAGRSATRRPRSAGSRTCSSRRWPRSSRPSATSRDPLQAYCDVLEEKWLLSEVAGRDVGLEAALAAYLDLGAPAPEDDASLADSSIALDIDWSGGLDQPERATPACDARRRRVHGTIAPMQTTGGVATDPVIRVARPGQALRRRQGGRRHRLRGRRRRGLRPARPERRRQDDHRRDPRGPALARTAAGRRCSAWTSRPDADSLKPRIGVSLQTAALYPKLTVVEVIDLFRSFYPHSAADRAS